MEVGQIPRNFNAPDGAAGDMFGISVAMTDKFIFVGAFNDDIGENIDQGSVYVYKIENGVVVIPSKTSWFYSHCQ